MTTHEVSQRRACGLIGITRRGLKRARQKIAIAGCVNDCVNWRRNDGAGVSDALFDAAPRELAGQP